MSMLPLTFMLPLIGFLILATMRDRLSENAAAVVGVGSMGLAALCALMAGSDFLMNHPQALSLISHCGRGCKSVVLPQNLVSCWMVWA